MLIAFWLVLSALMIMSFDIYSYSIKRAGWDRFVSTFFLYYSQVIVTEFTLGLVSNLTSLSLALLNVLILSLVTLFIRKKYGNEIFISYLINIKNTVASTWDKIKSDRLWLLLLIISAALLSWIMFLGIIFPATDFDGNSYHLTYIGYSLQNHNIFDAPTSLGWLTGYPKGGEFIEMWNVIIAKNDMLVDLSQLPFLFLGIYALYAISIRLGVSEKEARFSSVLFLFLPIVLNQLKTTYIDVMLCSLFFAAIAMVIKKKMNRLDLIILGIIYSLIISIKFTGFLFVAITIPFLMWNLFHGRNKKQRSNLKYYLSSLSIIFLPTLFGFYWYIKNYVLYHNPLYPFGLKLMGLSIFPGRTFQDLAASATNNLAGLPVGCLDRIWFVWTEQKDWFGCLYNYDANFTGLGPIWFIILLPAIIVSIYYIIKQKKYLYVAIIIALLSVFAVYPINYYSRYTMFITAVGIISLGIVLTNINAKIANIIKAITIILAISVIATNFALCNFPPGMVKSQLKSLVAGDARGVAYANTLGQSYVFIEGKLKNGDVIAYDSSPYFIYPLWKSDFSNKVTYLVADNRPVWLRKIKEERVKYIFTQIGSKEYKWAKDGAEFNSIYKDLQYEIFQVY